MRAPRVVVDDRRTRRHLEDQVVAGLAVATRLRAATAGRGLEVVAVLEVAQRRLAGVDAQVDRAAAPAVAAVGSAARDVRLLAEGRGPVTAIAGADPDLHAVEEHRGILARPVGGTGSGAGPAAGGAGRRLEVAPAG